MKLLIDMNLPPTLANMLSDRSIKSIHWSTVGAFDAKDSEIMSYASENDLIVMTCDLDFSTILSVTHGIKPSLVQIRNQRFNLEKLASIIAHSLPSNEQELVQCVN